MMRCLACLLVLVTTATGCHRPEDYLLGPSRADQVLSVTLSSTTMPADGIALVTITAQLDPRTDADKRSVTFTTTAGTLVAGGKEGPSITVPADTTGKAVVELRSSTTPATALLEVTVASVSRTASVAFLKLTREEVFDLSVSRTSVPADGFSTAVITVTLKKLGTPLQRAVRFETSAGTFIVAGQASSRTLTVTVDVTGAAVVVELQSEIAGTARVRVTALDTSQELEIAFTSLTREEVFDASVSRTSIPADGFSTTVITVRLKRFGTPQQRAVRFETSAGTFIAAGQASSRAVTVTADATGRAVVELQSEKIPGTARVRVTALDISQEFEITFTMLTPEEVFNVTVSRTSVPADGFSTAVITVTLKQFGTPQQRAVRFETSAGTLIAAGQASSRAVTVTADATGRAVVELQSEKTPGTTRVRVTALDISQEGEITFTPVDPAQIIKVSAAPFSGPADGVTPIIVSATVAAGLPAGRRSVTFRATLGQLLPTTTIEADGSNMARASLVSITTGVARITATVDGTTAETTAQFTVALPDRVIVAPDAVELKSGGSTTIRVTLIRATGSVSPRLEVSYSATTGTGAVVGSFSRVTLAENSLATATFNVGTTTFLGPVTIKASAEGGATGTATLQVVP